MAERSISDAVREAFAADVDSFSFEGVLYTRKGKTFRSEKIAAQQELASQAAPMQKTKPGSAFEKKASSKPDYREDITNKIIDLMESGNAVWQKPWDAKMGDRFVQKPMNPTTQKPYSGGNSISLFLSGLERDGGADPRWCTFKQAQKEGWKIKKGAKATVIEHVRFEEQEVKVGEQTEIQKVFAGVVYHNVFHASQVDGMPALPQHEPRKGYEGTNIELAEEILKKSQAKIYNDQVDRAFYRPTTDTIHLPKKEAFPKRENYYSTALHELSHWTGHASRLNRFSNDAFGTKGRAKEELRAELASVYLSMETGVPFEPGQHAAYTKSWISVLKDDKHEFFRAAKDAEKITEYVISLAKKQEQEKTQKQSVEAQIPAAEAKQKPQVSEDQKLDKSSVKEISIYRAEGPPDRPPRIQVTSFEEASKFLQEEAKTAPALNEGYNKCDVKITWSNGESYSTRYDLTALDQYRNNHLEWEVQKELQLAAGTYQPRHFTEEQWERHRLDVSVDSVQRCTEMLSKQEGIPLSAEQQHQQERFDAIRYAQSEKKRSLTVQYQKEFGALLQTGFDQREIDVQITAGMLETKKTTFLGMKELLRKNSPQAVVEKKYADSIIERAQANILARSQKQGMKR